MVVLVVNAGSSSLKLAVLDGDRTVASTTVQRWTGEGHLGVLGYLDSIEDLAALHNPRALAAIRAVRDLLPGVPAVACFDTTFHAHLPMAARTYAVPTARPVAGHAVRRARARLGAQGALGHERGPARRARGHAPGRPGLLARLRCVSCTGSCARPER